MKKFYGEPELFTLKLQLNEEVALGPSFGTDVNPDLGNGVPDDDDDTID